MEKLKTINTNINNLRIAHKHSNDRSSHFELNEIIKDTKDARAFIFLLDRFDTDKAITRETLEDLIENTYDFNDILIEFIYKKPKSKFNIDNYVTFKNIKMALLGSIFIGVIYGVSQSDKLLTSVLNYVGIEVLNDKAITTSQKTKEVKDNNNVK